MSDMFDNIKDPLDRIEQLEMIVMGQSIALEEAADQINKNNELTMRVTESLKEIARVIERFHRQLNNLNQRLTELEELE